MTKTLVGCIVQPENISAVIKLEDGKVVNKVIDKDNQYFGDVVAAVKTKDFENIIKFMLGYTVLTENADFASAQSTGQVTVEHGVVKFGGMEVDNALTQRMLRMLKEGFDIEPMRKFMQNVMQNPSNTAVNELYLFLEANSLSLTSDGYFLAYKSVNENFTSIHDGKTSNKIGEIVKMPRNMVDDNRNQTCSNGLHFASLDYVKNYFRGDKILALKINPANVVSIPSDYNNQKGRACEYEVIAEVTDAVKVDNRDPLSEAAVVDVGSFADTHQEATKWDDKLSIAENLRAKAQQQIRDAKGRFQPKK